MQYKFNKGLYSKEALIKAAYNFIDDFYLHLDCTDEYYLINIEPRADKKDFRIQEFINEMLIYETRRLVNERTGNIREMMYSRAMASTIIDEQIEDQEHESIDAENILVDWFEEHE